MIDNAFFLYIAHTFTAAPGVAVPMNHKEPIDFFRLFFSAEINHMIYTETTRYSEQHIAASHEFLEEHRHARQGWGRLQRHDYDYDYDYTMITKNDYNYSQRKLITITIMITNP